MNKQICVNYIIIYHISNGLIMNKFIFWACLFTLGACSPPNEELQQWMQNTKQQAKANITKPKEAKLNLQPAYTPPQPPQFNMFDPNRLKAGFHGVNAPNPNRPKEILENYALNDLRYVGLIKGTNKTPSAFIEANGHVYTVTIGNYLGQNYGHITAITPDEIVISELIEDANGSWNDHTNNLPIHSADASEPRP